MRSLIGRPKRQEDPAPSRLAYRLNRIMLRPVLRFVLFYGLPTCALPIQVTQVYQVLSETTSEQENLQNWHEEQPTH